MKIKVLKNIENSGNMLLCKQKRGIAISHFTLEFEKAVKLLEFDCCDCLNAQFIEVENELICRIVTEKSNIKEFIVLNVKIENKPQLIKLIYQR